MNILIEGDFIFPFGSASASRMRHFALGFKEAGANVRIISYAPMRYMRPEDIGADGQHKYMDIPYESVMALTQAKKLDRGVFDKALWLQRLLKGIRLATKKSKKFIQSGQVDVVLQYTISNYALKDLPGICRENNAVLIRDIVEWPARSFFKGGIFSPLYFDAQLGVHQAMLKSDGVIGISKFLTEYYSTRGTPSICIPAIVKVPEKVSEKKKQESKTGKFEITYLGDCSHREAPFEMIGAIKQVLSRNFKIKLTIVGCFGLYGFAKKVRRACESDALLKDNVTFLGRVSDEEVKKRLAETDALLFVRPDDITAKAAFPTRLPEYLITGNPVITAGVGDIPHYLRDGIDALVVKPCIADKIAEKIITLIQMPDKGKAIGLSGFDCANKYFNYKTRTMEILEFMEMLRKKK
jgi:glycosyltransferase involved in cell wall biosynthesis